MKFWIAFGVSCCLSLASIGFAEEGEGPPSMQYMYVHTDDVENAMSEAFEENGRAWVEAFREAEMGAEWNWWTSQVGSHYTWVSPMPDFAWLDQDEARMAAMKEALGEERLADLMKSSGAVRTHHSEVVKWREDLSYAPKAEEGEADEEAAPDTFLSVNRVWVRPSMSERFEALAKKAAAGFAKVGADGGWDGYSVEFGEGSYVFVSAHENGVAYHSETPAWQVLTEAYGEEEAKAMGAEWDACVLESDRSEARIRRDLSYVAGMPAPE